MRMAVSLTSELLKLLKTWNLYHTHILTQLVSFDFYLTMLWLERLYELPSSSTGDAPFECAHTYFWIKSYTIIFMYFYKAGLVLKYYWRAVDFPRKNVEIWDMLKLLSTENLLKLTILFLELKIIFHVLPETCHCMCDHQSGNIKRSYIQLSHRWSNFPVCFKNYELFRKGLKTVSAASARPDTILL